MDALHETAILSKGGIGSCQPDSLNTTSEYPWWGCTHWWTQGGMVKVNPGPISTRWQDVLPPNVVKSQSHETGCYDDRITHVCQFAEQLEKSKPQSHGFKSFTWPYRKKSYHLVNRGPGYFDQVPYCSHKTFPCNSSQLLYLLLWLALSKSDSKFHYFSSRRQRFLAPILLTFLLKIKLWWETHVAPITTNFGTTCATVSWETCRAGTDTQLIR